MSRSTHDDAALTSAIPMFVDQLCAALLRAKSSDVIDHEDISVRAARHGQDLLRLGFTIAQVVHAYGDVCQVIAELAVERSAQIPPDQLKTLNLCLDNAIAGAVTEYASERERAITREGTERLGILAHELRNRVNVGILAFDAIKSGKVAVGGSTGALLERSLNGVRDLVDRSLAEVRADAGLQTFERIPLADFLQEVQVGALLQAQSRRTRFTVAPVDPYLVVQGDRALLAAALANLLHNGFKFTPVGGGVVLRAHATPDRVFFEIEDECGGLPEGAAASVFRPFEQHGSDRTGVGLGLSICLKVAKAHHGELRVRDIPGKGCVFSLDIPARIVRSDSA
jgi:signal transduction histidine kinase